MLQDLIILLLITTITVSGRLSMSWEAGDDVVEKMRPGQDLEHMRLGVSFVNQDLRFVCQAEAAQVGELEFITSSEDIRNSIKSSEKEVDKVVGLYIISKKAIIDPVTEGMDSGKIKCEYDKSGGEKGSVNITLSVWKLTMKATSDVCEDKNGDITVTIEEAKQWSINETNVKNRVKEKIRELRITKELTEAKDKNMFTTTMSFKEVNENCQLRKMNDNIDVKGQIISGSSCFTAECCKEPYISTPDGPCSYEAKSKLVTFLISFFAGILGVDWFYLSGGDAVYIVAGIFKMITLGGLGVWWLVDWIRVLADSFPDGQGFGLYQDM